MSRLNVCPETGRSLDGISCAKHAANLWPSLDPQNLPDTKAGERYKLLMDEHAQRVAEAEEERVASRKKK